MTQMTINRRIYYLLLSLHLKRERLRENIAYIDLYFRNTNSKFTSEILRFRKTILRHN